MITRMMRCAALAAIAAAAGMTGCVAQDRHDDVEMTARSQAARIQELVQERDALTQMLSDKDGRIADLEADRGDLRDRVRQLNAQIASLGDRISSFDDRLTSVRLGALDPATDRALRALASRYPDLLAYDAALGMVQLGSDLTFASGSATVQASARDGLGQLARVLASSEGSGYSVRVVGHTDSVPPGRSRARFPTNRHLSVMRAIAVAEALQSAGLPAGRLEVAGWGEHRPKVPNNPQGGTAANRRVELYLVPNADTMTMGGATAPVGRSTTDASPRREAPMK